MDILLTGKLPSRKGSQMLVIKVIKMDGTLDFLSETVLPED